MRKLLVRIKREGDRGVVHRLRGQKSKRRLPERLRRKALKLVQAKYGPTVACEYLAQGGTWIPVFDPGADLLELIPLTPPEAAAKPSRAALLLLAAISRLVILAFPSPPLPLRLEAEIDQKKATEEEPQAPQPSR